MRLIRHMPPGVEVNGPYTPAIQIDAGDTKTLYISGQAPRDPNTGKKFTGSITRQTTLTMNNLKDVVESCGFKMSDIVKVTLYLTDSSNREKVNDIYSNYFPNGQYPTRSTVGAKNLPDGQGIEIDAIACREKRTESVDK